MQRTIGTVALIVGIALAFGSRAEAAALKVFVGGAMTETIEEIGSDFAKKTGNTLDYVSDTTGGLQKRLKAGEKADIIVVTQPGMNQLEKDGAIIAGSRVDLVRALIGIAVKKGAKSPDLSSADAFKASLLKVRSVAYVSPAAGGASGTYFEGLLKTMGIADRMKAKIVYRTQGSEVADAVAKGDAEIGVSFIAELAPNKGVSIAGPLPPEIQNATVYVAAIPPSGANGDAARAYLRAMKSPEGDAVFKKAGLEPLGAH